MIKKIWPRKAVFVSCGCCGAWHAQETPGTIDCRDDRYRFAIDEIDEIDEHYGDTNWEEIEPEADYEAHE